MRALVKKRKRTRETWSELCSIPRRNGQAATRPSISTQGEAVSPEDDDGRDLDDTDLPTGTRWMLHPHSQKKIKWDLLVAALIVYSTLSVPFRIGFERTAGVIEGIIDAVVDVAFLMDIVASFRTAFVDEVGTTILRPTASRYCSIL